MTQFFQFETDFVGSLKCIPMQVRYKLDTCGVKLKLNHWNKFPQDIREELCDRPCTTPEEVQDYHDWLHQQVVEHTATEAKAQDFDLTIRVEQWETLTPLQRFALIKLSRSSHENANFIPAMKEFGLA